MRLTTHHPQSAARLTSALPSARSEWEAHAASPDLGADTPKHEVAYKRGLGPTEVSYYLGSRGEGVESGVNDM